MTENLLDSPILYSLALTLLHFLWQGCLVAFALKCLLSITSYKSPQLRYLWSAIALTTCLILPIATFNIVYTPDYLRVGIQALNSVPSFNSTQSIAVINANWYQIIVDSLPFLSITWMTTVVVLSIKLLFELKQVNRLATTDTIAVNQTLQAKYTLLMAHFSLWRKPQLLISLNTEVPMAIGWLKPVILLPAAMISGLTSAQLEMLILHELAHIKRHDYLVNFLQTAVEILLFFHPGVRWISKQMRNEREYCSDDIAVQHCGNAIAYAHTLADTASLCHKHRHSSIPTMAMAASGGDLKQRVVRLINQEHTCTTENDSGKLLASIVILFAISSVFAKPFIDNRFIDWGAGRISLMQSAGELLQRRVNSEEHPLSQTSIAQQLVVQNTSAPPLTMTSTNTLPQPKAKVLNNTADAKVKIVQLNKLPSSTVADKSIKKDLPSENQQLTAKVPNVVELQKTNRTAKDKVDDQIARQPTADVKQPQQVLSNFALEKSDEHLSQFNNPYASQVALLTEEPLPSSDKIIELTDNLNQSSGHHFAPPPSKITSDNNDTKKLITQTSAKLVSSVEPRYPSIAKRKGIEIDVLVTFVINKDGVVSDIEFEEKNKVSYFRTAVRSAMNKWQFLPAKVNNEPVESQMSKIFSFSLIKS